MNVHEMAIYDNLSNHVKARAEGTIVAEVPIRTDNKDDFICVSAIRIKKGLLKELHDPNSGRNHNLVADDFKSYLKAFAKLYPLISGELLGKLFELLMNKSAEISMDFTGDVFYMHNDHYVIAFWYGSNDKVTYNRTNANSVRLN
jgi:hypothetical protein